MADNSPNGMPVQCSVWEGSLGSLYESPCNALNGNEWWDFWELRRVTCTVASAPFRVPREYLRGLTYESPEWAVESFKRYESEELNYHYIAYSYDETGSLLQDFYATYDCAADVTIPSGGNPPWVSLTPTAGNQRLLYTTSSGLGPYLVYESGSSYYNYWDSWNPIKPTTPYFWTYGNDATATFVKCFSVQYGNPAIGDYTASYFTITSGTEMNYGAHHSYCRSRVNPDQTFWDNLWANNRNISYTYNRQGQSDITGVHDKEMSPYYSYVSSSGAETVNSGSAAAQTRVNPYLSVAANGFNFGVGFVQGQNEILGAGFQAQHTQLKYNGVRPQNYVLIEMPSVYFHGNAIYNGQKFPYMVVGSGTVSGSQIIDVPVNNTMAGAAYVQDFGGSIGRWPIYIISTFIFIQDDPNAPPNFQIGTHELERVTSWS